MHLTLTTDEPYEQMRKLFATELAREHERSTAELRNDGGKATFVVTATDTSALRASVNTITTILSVWEKTKTATGKHS